MATEKFVVFSGGGAGGVGQWQTYKEWLAEGNEATQFGGTSAGCLNALFASRGLIDLADKYYAKTYDGTAATVFGSELCDLRSGKLVPNLDAIRDTVLKGINVWDVPKLITKRGQKSLLGQLASNALGIQSLLNNKPLLQSISDVLEVPHEYEKTFLFNVCNMITGGVERFDCADFPDNRMRSLAIVASTTIPGILPLIPGFSTKEASYRMLGDGGMRDGSPVGQMLKRLDPDKDQEIVIFNINRREMSTAGELNNIFAVAARTLSILMNEVLMGDLELLLERNKTASMFGERPGYKYVPVKLIEASHNRTAFDFTQSSYDEQLSVAKKDLQNAITLNY